MGLRDDAWNCLPRVTLRQHGGQPRERLRVLVPSSPDARLRPGAANARPASLHDGGIPAMAGRRLQTVGGNTMNARIFAFVRWLVTLLVLRPYAAANTTNRPLAYSVDASKFLLGDWRLAYLLNLLWSERVASRGSDRQPCRKSMAEVGGARQPFQVTSAVVALYAVAMINLMALGLRAVERFCYQYVNVSP